MSHRLMRSLLMVATSLGAAAGTAAAQANRFTFLGDFRAMERTRGGIVARGDAGAVEITEVASVGFRIRYSFTGAFDTAPSLAVLADSRAPRTTGGAGDAGRRHRAPAAAWWCRSASSRCASP